MSPAAASSINVNDSQRRGGRPNGCILVWRNARINLQPVGGGRRRFWRIFCNVAHTRLCCAPIAFFCGAFPPPSIHTFINIISNNNWSLITREFVVVFLCGHAIRGSPMPPAAMRSRPTPWELMRFFFLLLCANRYQRMAFFVVCGSLHILWFELYSVDAGEIGVCGGGRLI